jgi:transcriptional regulator of acetoin/glycerol metabolism
MAQRRATVGQVLDVAVRDAVIAAYRATNWNSTYAAARLGVSRRTLLRWVARYRLRTFLDKERNRTP